MKIAFLGDSITYGYGLDNLSDRYSKLVCDFFKAEEENFGITGTLIARAGLNRNNGRAFIDRINLIKGADYAVVFGGTNDYFWSDNSITGADKSDNSFFESAILNICKYCKTIEESTKTLLVTPYSHHGVGNYWEGKDWRDSCEHDTTAKNFNGHTLEDYVNVIETVGKIYDIPVLNLHKELGFDWKIHTIDGCHPNPLGHEWIANAVIKNLSKLL